MPTSIWLRPEIKVAAWLDEAIAEIAQVAGHTVFAAHLTVATGPGPMDGRTMRDLAAAGAPVVLTPSGLLQTEQFTRTFAMAFACTAELDRLRAQMLAALKGQDNAPFVAHVSLIYGKADVAPMLEALAARIDEPIRFDRIVAVEAPDRNVSQADVAQWRVGPEYSLGA